MHHLRHRHEHSADPLPGEAGDHPPGREPRVRRENLVRHARHPDPDEGLARAGQRLAERPRRGQVGCRRRGPVPGQRRGVVEGQVDDRVRASRGRTQPVGVRQIAKAHLGAQHLHRGGRGLRTGQAHDLVSGLEQFGDDGGTDVTAGARDENPHQEPPAEVM